MRQTFHLYTSKWIPSAKITQSAVGTTAPSLALCHIQPESTALCCAFLKGLTTLKSHGELYGRWYIQHISYAVQASWVSLCHATWWHSSYTCWGTSIWWWCESLGRLHNSDVHWWWCQYQWRAVHFVSNKCVKAVMVQWFQQQPKDFVNELIKLLLCQKEACLIAHWKYF